MERLKILIGLYLSQNHETDTDSNVVSPMKDLASVEFCLKVAAIEIKLILPYRIQKFPFYIRLVLYHLLNGNTKT